jgi:superoxide dismutase, Cu-Zn family
MRSITAVAAVAILATGALATGIGAALATGGDDRSERRATAVLRDADGERVGVAVFKERRGKVTVSASVWSFAPEFHGFHVHSVGECVTPFTSAGGHYNPDGGQHGAHAGDLPSLLVNRDGTGQLQFATDRFSVSELFDTDGSALIVHAGRDNYANILSRYHSHTYDTFGPDPETLSTGDAGDRAACGVVEMNRGDDDD